LYNDATHQVQGLGFSVNTVYQVFSGEWSLGAVSMLQVLSYQYRDNAEYHQVLIRDMTDIRNSVESRLTTSIQFKNGVTSPAVLYANKRYFIPFGWWSLTVPSQASTGWAVMVDNHFNPFVLGGGLEY